jgi:Cu(I)/Ag(I) efflux system membrane fusion protein
MTTLRTTALLAALTSTFVLTATVAYRLGRHSAGVTQASASSSNTRTTDPANGRKVLYWQDPMVPGQRFDKPGKSPYMDMPLVPIFADENTDAGSVNISPRQTQNLGLRLIEALPGQLHPQLSISGNVAWNERGLTIVQARATGFVEKLHVRATLDPVHQGQALADLYFPDWVAAQEEFLAIVHMQGDGLSILRDGARNRMRQAGMSDALIAEVEHSGRVHPRITLSAPTGGRIIELPVREGMTVSAGSTLFQINSLDTVWVNAEVPEAQAAQVQAGAHITATATSYPGRIFTGRVQSILPELDPATRTLKARIELSNPGSRLIPGMFVHVNLSTPSHSALLLPAQSIIHTGQRTVVILSEGEGKFRPAEVLTGEENEGQIEILKGLEAGQKVVASGQFLIDSEASLRAVELRNPPAAAAHYEVDAVFEALDDKLAMLSHPAIPALKWGAMTMGFSIPSTGWPKQIKPGQHIHVSFVLKADGTPQIADVTTLPGASK